MNMICNASNAKLVIHARTARNIINIQITSPFHKFILRGILKKKIAITAVDVNCYGARGAGSKDKAHQSSSSTFVAIAMSVCFCEMRYN